MGLGSLLALTLLGILLAALALVPGRLPRLRLAAVLVAPVAILLVWQAVRAYEGWPVAVNLPPSGAVFVAADVDQGRAIYLWLASPENPRPRAYRIPYSDQAYAQVLRAQQAQKHGQQVRVAGRHGGKHGGRAGSGARIPRLDFRAYRLPEPSPPAKTR